MMRLQICCRNRRAIRTQRVAAHLTDGSASTWRISSSAIRRVELLLQGKSDDMSRCRSSTCIMKTISVALSPQANYTD
jgi:hypothetical protein